MKYRQLSIGLALLMGFFFLTAATAGPAKKKTVSIGFYNVENLFDTEDDPDKNDQEFLPGGSYGWNKDHLKIKLDNLGKVISELGDDDGPEILGLAEVENKAVVEMLCKNSYLKKKGYEVVHAESPDQRGIDCALIYKKKFFLPLYQKSYSINFSDVNPDITTRDILLVKGILDQKHEVTFLVNHWSSRRGGKKKSDWKRVRAAQKLRHVVDSIMKFDPLSNVVIMGDFNDEPADSSVHNVLRAGKDNQQAALSKLYNCFYKLQDDGMGSLKYKQYWDMFDQVILSHNMVNGKSPLHYIDCSASIYNPKWMRVPEGDWKDAPKRSHIRRQFHEDGYSDHFPVFIQLEY